MEFVFFYFVEPYQGTLCRKVPKHNSCDSLIFIHASCKIEQ